MSTFISKVEDSFQISGRGCIIVPGIPGFAALKDLNLKAGDPIVLKCPDGSEIQTIIRAFDSPNANAAPIVLGSEITRNMVPVGTELWTTANWNPARTEATEQPTATPEAEKSITAPETKQPVTSITAEGERQNWRDKSFIIQEMPGPADDGSRGDYVALIRTKNGQYGKFFAELTWNILYGPTLGHDIRWRYYVQFDDGRTGIQACGGGRSGERAFEKLLEQIVPQVT